MTAKPIVAALPVYQAPVVAATDVCHNENQKMSIAIQNTTNADTNNVVAVTQLTTSNMVSNTLHKNMRQEQSKTP